MPFKKHSRQYDLVVFGATGYTGKYAAHYITSSLPTNLKWAVAGRSSDKLAQLVEECKALNPDRVQPGIEICGLDDGDLAALAKKAFVLMTTVGPYAKYGEGVLKACAENGTHYLDVTGEVVWVHRMIRKYEAAAAASGAVVIPEIGVESAPADLVTWSLAALARREFAAPIGETVVATAMSAQPSGGTLDTVICIPDIFTAEEMASAFEPYALSPVPNPTAPPPASIATRLTGVRSVPHLGILTTAMVGTTDRAIVQRSWGLMASVASRRAQAYGPNFSYQQYQRVNSRLHGFASHLYTTVLRVLLASPLRRVIPSLLYRPGDGPSADAGAKDTVEYRGIATPDKDGVDKKVYCRLSFKGSMYFLSTIFLSQAALTILKDDLGLDGGMYTPSCLGQGFIDRLTAAGLEFESAVLDV